jgi:hypothetical protein
MRQYHPAFGGGNEGCRQPLCADISGGASSANLLAHILVFFPKSWINVNQAQVPKIAIIPFLLPFQKLARFLLMMGCNRINRYTKKPDQTKKRNLDMLTLSHTNRFSAAVAAILFAAVTIGTSVAPAVAAFSPLAA